MSTYTLGVVGYIDRVVERRRLEIGLQPDLISVDDGRLGVMGNHLAVLKALHANAVRGGSDWVVVLEDDAVPTSMGFHSQLSAALEVAPSTIVSLYNGSGYPGQRQADFRDAAARQDICWIKHRWLRHAVGYALHLDLFTNTKLLDDLEGLHRVHWPPDDAISDFALRHAIPVSYTNPSLVDHQDGPAVIHERFFRGRPIFGRRERKRVAHNPGTRLSWDDSSVTI